MLLRLLVAAAFLAPVIWGLVDVARRPKEAFEAAGQRRGVWIGLLLVALLAPVIVGTGVGLWYLVVVRPKVARAVASSTPPDER
jgi:hypothetical protein